MFNLYKPPAEPARRMVKPRTPEEEAAFLVALRETAERSMAEDEARQAQETDSETQA